MISAYSASFRPFPGRAAPPARKRPPPKPPAARLAGGEAEGADGAAQTAARPPLPKPRALPPPTVARNGSVSNGSGGDGAGQFSAKVRGVKVKVRQLAQHLLSRDLPQNGKPPGYNMTWFCIHSMVPLSEGCKECGVSWVL